MEQEIKPFNINDIELYGTWIMFKNPVLKSIDKSKYDKLPKSQQDNFMLNSIMASEPLFYDVELLSVGCDCTKFTVGDHAFITMEIASGGTKIANGEYILIRESSILGKNVRTQEDI